MLIDPREGCTCSECRMTNTRIKRKTMTFAIVCNTFGRKFSFHAESMDDAVSKAKRWCHHHGFCFREEYFVEEISESNPFDLHDDWID